MSRFFSATSALFLLFGVGTTQASSIGDTTTLPGTGISLCYTQCSTSHCYGPVGDVTYLNNYWAVCPNQAPSQPAKPSTPPTQAVQGGGALGVPYFGGLIVAVVPCPFTTALVLTITGPHYNGPALWQLPVVPPYLMNGPTPPVPGQCVIANSAPLTCDGVPMPRIVNYGSSLPGCVLGGGSAPGTQAPGAGSAQSGGKSGAPNSMLQQLLQQGQGLLSGFGSGSGTGQGSPTKAPGTRKESCAAFVSITSRTAYTKSTSALLTCLADTARFEPLGTNAYRDKFSRATWTRVGNYWRVRSN